MDAACCVQARIKRMKISLIAWDIGHNPVGRVHIIAEALSREFEVEIIGAQFPMYGDSVWEPIQGTGIPIKVFPGTFFPRHFWSMESISNQIDGDVIYVFKPRLPSFELGILAKMLHPRPLILDIDDYELSFFEESNPCDLNEIKMLTQDKDFLVPYGNLWTRYSDSLVPCVDTATVSNSELQKKYGGNILPHVKNEQTFNPNMYDRDEIRSEFGIKANEKIILFVGTPRAHKGILDIVRALEVLDNENYKLCIIGTPVDRQLDKMLRNEYSKYVYLHENQPVKNLPRNLMVGDVICLLQDPGSRIAAYQMPSKFTDGLSMGIPMICTEVPPLLPMIERNLVEPLGRMTLHEKLDEVFSNYPVFKKRAVKNRAVFLSEYSYKFAGKIMKDIIASVCKNPLNDCTEYEELIQFHRIVFKRKKPFVSRLLIKIFGSADESKGQ
jgi:glycosyltransferase involved in cell wall biosynthesis